MQVAIDKQTGQYNPYLAARLAWDERYGGVLSREAMWRRTAIGSILIAILLAIAVGILTANAKHVRPYVAVVDGATGRQIAEASEDTPERREWRRENALKSWIEDTRTVTVDAGLMRKMALRAMALLGDRTPAQNYVVGWWKSDPPTERARKETVDANATSVLKIGDATYLVEWTEITHPLQGEAVTRHWKASLTVAIREPETKESAQSNALGLFITNASWTQVREEENK